jgi:prepilin-type processing-associated H-X9-DG protein
LPREIGGKYTEEFLGEPLTDTQVTHPSQTLLLLDSGYAVICWWHATDVVPVTPDSNNIEDTAYVPGLKINKARLLWSKGGQEYDAIYGRHPRKTVNVGYVDGHVARIEADELMVEKTSDDYKNVVPLWRSK